jgi:hypothetical protein
MAGFRNFGELWKGEAGSRGREYRFSLEYLNLIYGYIKYVYGVF